MEIDYGLELSQSQKLIMTTKLMQSLKILNMSAVELENEIKKQAEENPIIEIDTKDNDRTVDWEKYIKNMQKYTYKDKNEFAYNVDNEVDFENMVRANQNLYDYLKNQIRYYKIDKTQRKICEYIIDSLDENGYLNEQDEKLIMEKLKIDKNTYDTCKGYVQSLEPNGVGGTTLEECLSIQLKNLNIKDNLLDQIIKEDLNNIANKKIKPICKKYSINKEQCINYIKIIKHLEPKPGKMYNTNDVQYIKPDVIIRKINGSFIVVSNDKNDISININSFYQNMLNKEDADEETKKFIKERLDSALNLIKNIENRKSTTIKIAKSILKRQKEFFEKGTNYIKPMKMQELADELNLHQSTISRGVNGKYMLTPFGMFEFKYFFSKGLETQGTKDTSAISIKNFIKDIIRKENKTKPLSDEKIKQLLNKNGVNISRRTVTKYREELEILPSNKRKTLFLE
ncbi:RNA polymerase factor sigma-54 [Intestinibacter sp.]|uniref:RNA polymerase factor sigma-54 n=1 Tax=Intestinibacter sp. TaxID=1965304 RepID=UPI003F16E75E